MKPELFRRPSENILETFENMNFPYRRPPFNLKGKLIDVTSDTRFENYRREKVQCSMCYEDENSLHFATDCPGYFGSNRQIF